jgi:dethiobiotin synthetase
MTGLLITGTDTGVGKTFFACALSAVLSAMGKRVGVMKPVETGCELGDGQLVPADALRLRHFSGSPLPLELVCPYRFAPPLAPAVAAEMAGVKIEQQRLIVSYERIRARHDITLVEGAGGLLVPLTERYTFADLARDLGIPLLVVVGSKLGAINHALLTLHCASSLGLSVLGYILNHPNPTRDLAAETNRRALAGLTDTPCLGSLPFFPPSGDESQDRASLVALMEGEVDLAAISKLMERGSG